MDKQTLEQTLDALCILGYNCPTISVGEYLMDIHHQSGYEFDTIRRLYYGTLQKYQKANTPDNRQRLLPQIEAELKRRGH